MTGWAVEVRGGSAAELHALEPPTDRRTIWVLEAAGPAVVLGSTQPDEVVDVAAAARAGVAVARRRSGGGAVWVAPGEPIWIDVVVPRHDPLWTDDVGRAFLPIGAAWSRALDALGVPGTRVHDGPLVRTPWSDLVCFAGIGPGEVLVAGAKVVGISQRRTREAARFQCAAPRTWDPGPLLEVLRQPPGLDPAPLAAVGRGLGASTSTDDVVAALVDALTWVALD